MNLKFENCEFKRLNSPLTHKSKRLFFLAVKNLLSYQLHDAVAENETQAVTTAASKTAHTRRVHESQKERRKCDANGGRVVSEKLLKPEEELNQSTFRRIVRDAGKFEPQPLTQTIFKKRKRDLRMHLTSKTTCTNEYSPETTKASFWTAI